jgi:MYXO-CTERM domain-containing protein
MKFSTGKVVLGVTLLLALPARNAAAHWCDDLWSSGYDIVVRPDSDTSPKKLYVENRWGYQLTNFKLTATSSSGGAITLTPPTTLKMANTLLPGEKGIWTISAGSPSKIEDITFDVRFGDTSGATPKQWGCYPVLGASPVMVVKNDGSLFPTAITGIDAPKSNSSRGCSLGDVGLGTSLQDQTIADWEDVGAGLDALLHIYCAGRASWGVAGPVGSYVGEGVTPTYCKDAASTTCPASKITSSPGSRSDYMHLWAAGALAIRKSALGARLSVVRERLKCGANDGDVGIAGYTLFTLGYLGEDAGAKSFLQTQANASGDIGTIAKAALYLMGDSSQKSAVQAGVKSTSVFVKVACAGALGIVDKDDDAVNSAIIPEVKWIEPDNLGGTSDGGKGMYSVHILEIVAFDRRGWVFKGNAEAPVTFYGETAAAAGGSTGSGTGGSSGKGGAGGSDAGSVTGGAVGTGTGGTVGSGGRSGTTGPTPGTGGVTSSGGSTATSGSGGQGSGGAQTPGSGGNGSGGQAGNSSSSASPSTGGSTTASAGGTAGPQGNDTGNGCKCDLGGHARARSLWLLGLFGLTLVLSHRRRQR